MYEQASRTQKIQLEVKRQVVLKLKYNLKQTGENSPKGIMIDSKSELLCSEKESRE